MADDASILVRGKLAPVYIVASDHPILVDRFVGAVRAAAVPEAMRAFNEDIIEGKASASRIVAAAQTLPMMAERRLVFVRDLAPFAAADLAHLATYLANPSPSTVLVCVTTKLDKRLKFYATAKKAGYLHELSAPRQLGPWIRDEAKRHGAKLSSQAADRLGDAVGADLSRLAVALEQLSLFARDRTIEADDVDELIADTRERSVFELTDAVGEANLGRALSAVASLADQRQSAIGVVAMLARHVRQLAMCHVGREDGVARGDLAKLVGAPPFVVDKLIAQSRVYSPAAVAGALESLALADRLLKGMSAATKTLGRDLSDRVIMERLVSDIIASAATGSRGANHGARR